MGKVSEDRGTNKMAPARAAGKRSEGGAPFLYGVIVAGVIVFCCGQRTLSAQPEPGVITATDFVRLVFQSSDPETARRQLDVTLQREIRGLDQLCQLTELQEQKLKLAGQGDIKRLLDRVDAARRQLEPAAGGPAVLDNELWRLIYDLRREMTDELFNESSLFLKVRERILTPVQSARLQRTAQEQRDPAFYSAVRAYILSAEKSLELTAAQSDALENLLIDTLPRTGMGAQYQNYLIAYRVSKIPEEQFAAILDQPQLEALQSVLSHARALEPFLRRQGWVEDENADQLESEQ